MSLYNYDPLGSQHYVADLSDPVPVDVPANSNGLLVQVFAKDVYFTVDGSTPSATNRFVLTADADAQFLPFAPGTTLTFVEKEASAAMTWLPVAAFMRRAWTL